MTIGHLLHGVNPNLDTRRSGPLFRCMKRGRTCFKKRASTPTCRDTRQNPATLRGYSFSDPGSERFFGDFLLRTEISSWAEGGTATAPLRTMSTASIFLPYIF